eukprot:scaffold1724_cov246-Pinguiococcus_pyrenoidosus.AAC.20
MQEADERRGQGIEITALRSRIESLTELESMAPPLKSPDSSDSAAFPASETPHVAGQRAMARNTPPIHCARTNCCRCSSVISLTCRARNVRCFPSHHFP